jgi:uncharacterized protein (UPF0371 family)
MVLPDGSTVTGKTSPLLGASSALLLNALKKIAGISHDEDIISPDALKPICDLKVKKLHHKNPRLHSEEVLIALSISSVNSKSARKALGCIDDLKGSDAHFSVILSPKDEDFYKRLGINVTCEPKFEVK